MEKLFNRTEVVKAIPMTLFQFNASYNPNKAANYTTTDNPEGYRVTYIDDGSTDSSTFSNWMSKEHFEKRYRLVETP